MATSHFHHLIPMRETHSRHHNLFELTVLLERRAPLQAAQPSELDVPSSLESSPQQPLLNIIIFSEARPSAARSRSAQRQHTRQKEHIL